MKLALGLDVQTNAKGGKFMSIEDSRQGALVCKADVEVLWEPGNFQDKHVKCKMDLEPLLGPRRATARRAPRSSHAAGAARLWRPDTMARHEVRHLMLEPLEAAACP